MTSMQSEKHAGQMRAVVHERYGPPDVLHVESVAQPIPGPDQLLVEVHACTVNRTDCGFRAAKPFVVRLFGGLFRPRKRILGTEFAGIVEAVGNAVTAFAIGDRVFGVNADVFGAQAEYVLVKQDAPVAIMPEGRQGRRNVPSTDLGPWQQNPGLALWTARFGRKRVAFPLPRYTKADVELIRSLVEAGEYRAVVDRLYTLEQVVAATRYVETETKTGSVALCIAADADRISDPGTRG